MTPASLAQISRGSRRPERRRRKKSRAQGRARASHTGKRARNGSKRRRAGRKLKFGSPAWQKKYKVGRFAKKRR